MEIYVSLAIFVDLVLICVCWSKAYDPKALRIKSSTTVLKSSVLLISLSMDNVASPTNHSCDIVDSRYEFTGFNLQNLLKQQ
jgi:hypothetical protein